MTGYVYFIRNKDGRHWKIGYSEDVVARIRQLNGTTASGVELIAAVAGTLATERQFHEIFSGFRESGEWFNANDRLAELADTIGLPESLAIDYLTIGDVASGTESEAVEQAAGALETILDTVMAGQRCTMQHALTSISEDLQVPRNTLWSLRYRRPRSVTAGVHIALLREAERLAKNGTDYSYFNPREEDRDQE